MAKLRFNEKKIAQTPFLKKRMARFVASIDMHFNECPSIEDMLIYGVRGYAQYSESDLCNLFDKSYKRILQAYEEHKQQYPDPGNYYSKHNGARFIELIHEAQEIGNEVFENQVLK